jgi:hypothetical protein
MGTRTAAPPSAATTACASVDLPPPGAPAMPRIVRGLVRAIAEIAHDDVLPSTAVGEAAL